MNKEFSGKTMKIGSVTITCDSIFNIHDNGKVENHFHVHKDGKDDDEDMLDAGEGDAQGADPSQQMVDRLMPFFYNDRKEVELFVRSVSGAKPMAVVDVVNKLIKAKKISDKSCKRDLWKVMHEEGLYGPGESNWNQYVRMN